MGTVTHEDVAQALSDALTAAQSGSDGSIDYSCGLSMSEISDALGVGIAVARRRIRKAISDGTVECMGRQQRPNIANEMNAVPVYRAKGQASNG